MMKKLHCYKKFIERPTGTGQGGGDSILFLGAVVWGSISPKGFGIKGNISVFLEL